MSNQYFEGVVDTWVDGEGKWYGFIAYQVSGREQRIFFPAGSIRLDGMGRRGHSTYENALVRFKIEQVVHKGQPRVIAVDVHPVFCEQEEATVSLEDHREVSQVQRINPPGFSVWMRREDGSEMFLHKDKVVPEHLDRFMEIQVGDFVYHGIAMNEKVDRWGATCAEIFSREEQTRLQQGLPAQPEPEPEPEPVLVAATPESEPVPEILAPNNKNKTLLQLVEMEKRARRELQETSQAE